VATAKDESDGSAVGTTAAVLDRGEELRPTGSDRALLVRITSMTGGKMRDTLAGVFDDRSARRFSYAPLARWLTLLAGVALVLAVAARKAGVPDAVARRVARSPAHVTQPPSRQRSERAPGPAAGREVEAPGSPKTDLAPRDHAPRTPAPRRPLSSAEVLARKRRERR
jgi:hypothetical protein